MVETRPKKPIIGGDSHLYFHFLNEMQVTVSVEVRASLEPNWTIMHLVQINDMTGHKGISSKVLLRR